MATDDFLVTERLRLCLWATDDAALVKALHADPTVNRYLSQKTEPWSDKKAARRLAQWREEFERDGLTKFKLLRHDGLFLGRAGFSLLQERGEFELGYSILREHWGHGYATEAAAGLARRFFEMDIAQHFAAFAHVDNVASHKVLEKIGMQFERTGSYLEMPFRFYRMDKPSTAR